MFQANSSTVVCPSCGKRNSARVNFCTACAGRLGKEPSIAPVAQPAATTAAATMRSRASGGDTRLEASRGAPSRPMSMAAQAPDSTPLGFWFKFCMTGLVLAIAFITWAIYTMTGSRAVSPVPSTQVGAAPATQSAPSAVAPSAMSPSQPAASTAATAAAPAAAAAAPSATTVVAPVAPTPVPTPAPETRVAASAARASSEARRADESGAQQQSAARRQAWRERARLQAQDAEEIAAATRPGAWVTPDRPPVSTAAPGFQDAGPPVVQGPGPAPVYPLYGSGFREAALAPRASATPPASAGPDAGPPIAAGPGPQYDFSTPGANRR